jgi:hypothetical protein
LEIVNAKRRWGNFLKKGSGSKENFLKKVFLDLSKTLDGRNSVSASDGAFDNKWLPPRGSWLREAETEGVCQKNDNHCLTFSVRPCPFLPKILS